VNIQAKQLLELALGHAAFGEPGPPHPVESMLKMAVFQEHTGLPGSDRGEQQRAMRELQFEVIDGARQAGFRNGHHTVIRLPETGQQAPGAQRQGAGDK